MNIIVACEPRTGSTWLIDILRLVLNKGYAGNNTHIDKFKKNFNLNRIQHTHKYTLLDIIKHLYPWTDYFVIATVRNPRDRLTSVAHRHLKQNLTKSVDKRLSYLVSRPEKFTQQQNRMLEGYSTRQYNVERSLPYIWTSYEWMKQDIYKEVGRILEFIGEHRASSKLKLTIDAYQELAEKEKGNLGKYRKGVINDWKNHFTQDMVIQTQPYQDMYYKLLRKEVDEQEDSPIK